MLARPRYPFVFFFLLFTINAIGQFTEKYNFQFRNGNYNVFKIEAGAYLSQRFELLENPGRKTGKELFDSAFASSRASFFAMTASIVDSSCAPLGLFVSNKRVIRPVNLSAGSGNFYLKPNGYIALDTAGKFTIQDAVQFSDSVRYRYAIQSGPLLVRQAEINTAFNKSSKNLNVRCGVGITVENGETFLVFIKSNTPVSFYQFAEVFRDEFKCSDALNIESGGNCFMHLPNLGAKGTGLPICRYLVIRLDK